MAAKKTKKSPSNTAPAGQTLLFIKPKKEEPLAESIPEVVEKLPSEPPAEPIQDVVVEPKSAAPLKKPVPLKPVKKSATVASEPTHHQEPDSNEISADHQDNADVRSPIFQAVGIIVGKVSFDELGKAKVMIAQREYSLFCASRYRKAFNALQKQVQAAGGENIRLIVYPKVMHFPKKEQSYRVSFQLVGFDTGRFSTGIASQMEDFEFKLCGLWQFIPVCSVPCISVFKNFNPERLEYIKQAQLEQKLRFMKASHLPLLWKDAPVRPFRFNPKLDKEQQGHSSFVEVKAKFIPGRDVFGFVELLSPPADKAPNFLKAGKADKALALKNKIQQQKSFGAKPNKKIWDKKL